MTENLYNVLGVDEKSTKDEIKKAYRGLQMKWHPDRNQGSEDSKKMSEKINGAYEVLGDDEKRLEYDNISKNPFARMNGGGMEVPMDDILNMFFKGMPGFPGMPPGFPGMPPGFPGMPPGAKVHVFNGSPMGFNQSISKPIPIMKTIEINMSQVLSGASIPLEIERWIIENQIKVYEKETIYVTVPKGIDDNEMIILRDSGNVLNENVKGDIKIFVKIKNETPFKRVGLDLILNKTISLKDSLCGFTFELDYINGKSYTLNNNKGNINPSGYKKIYQGMGLTRGDHKGNMIIQFNVIFPDKLTEEQIVKLTEIL